MKRSLFYFAFVILLLVAPSRSEKSDKDDTVAYVKASLPNQIFRCITRFDLLRCLKYFVLLRLESRDYQHPETEQSTSEFLGNILKSEVNLPKEIPEKLLNLDEKDLNARLTEGFQKFFKTRPIMLRFIPNMLVKIIPSKSNDLEFSIKKYEEVDFSSRSAKEPVPPKEPKESKESDESKESEEDEKEGSKDPEAVKDDGYEKNGMRKKTQYLSVGLPLILAPAMVFAGFLPMLIPVLKLVTAITVIINTTALVASIFYLARQHALEREMTNTVYFNPGYKERK